MLHSKNLDQIVFADLETTSQYPSFKEMPEKLQEIFKRRYKKDFVEINEMPVDSQELAIEDLYSRLAPLQPEWGRILCISMGILTIPEKPEGDYVLQIKSYADKDENKLLADFIAGTVKSTAGHVFKWAWCFHNGTTFDVPYIAKRIIINELPLPGIWDFGHLKPWEMGDRFIDTKTVWRFGVYDNNVSLDHLAYIFGIPSSKEGGMDGASVKDEFWLKDNLAGITLYCERDIVALCQIYLKMKGMKNKVVRS